MEGKIPIKFANINSIEGKWSNLHGCSAETIQRKPRLCYIVSIFIGCCSHSRIWLDATINWAYQDVLCFAIAVRDLWNTFIIVQIPHTFTSSLHFVKKMANIDLAAVGKNLLKSETGEVRNTAVWLFSPDVWGELFLLIFVSPDGI